MRVHARQGEIAENPLQDVVEVVRDAAREQADGLQLALLQQFRLGFLAGRDVAENDHHTDDVPLPVMDRRGSVRNGALGSIARDQDRRFVRR